MASALCALACERGLEARFFTVSSLVMRLRRARDDGRLDRGARSSARPACSSSTSSGFSRSARTGRGCSSGSSPTHTRGSRWNLEFSRWGSVFGDDQMAAAVIDRIVHHGRPVQFRGESYRVRHALMQEG